MAKVCATFSEHLHAEHQRQCHDLAGIGKEQAVQSSYVRGWHHIEYGHTCSTPARFRPRSLFRDVYVVTSHPPFLRARNIVEWVWPGDEAMYLLSRT